MESTKRVREKGWPLPLRRQVDQTIHLLSEQEWIVQLLVRVFVGYFFMETGWGKLHNLDGFARRFAGWGIPLAALQRRVVRIHRVYWGSAYYLRNRHAVGVDTDDNQHVVAILTVNLKSVNSLDDFFELDEPLYALTYLWLLISGPGWVSADYLISRVFRLNSATAEVSSVSSKESAVLKHNAATVP